MALASMTGFARADGVCGAYAWTWELKSVNAKGLELRLRLPPGPIANPGRASLEATANPARTKELFFVADGTGGHAFSDTYEQHQRHVARLRSIEQQARGAAQPAAAPRTR